MVTLLEPVCGDHPTRVLVGVLAVDHPTIGTLATATGLARSTVHGHLMSLRRLGLVTWTDGRQGTLRPLVKVVAASWA